MDLKTKTKWEQYRATILNYTAGLITMWVFGFKYLVIDLFELGYFILGSVFSLIIFVVTWYAIWKVCDNVIKIREIMNK